MRKSIFRNSLIVALITFFILVALIGSLQYVGVYVIYVGLPILLISSFIAYFTRPKDDKQSIEYLGL